MMRRGLVTLLLLVGCYFAAIMLAMLYYLLVDAPDFPPLPENPVFWATFSPLVALTLWWRRRKSGGR